MKRGNAPMEALGAFIFLFLCFAVGALVLMLLGSFNDEWQQTVGVDEYSKQESQSYVDLTQVVLDGAFIFYLGLLWMATLVTAFFLDNTPLYFAIFVILGIITFFIIIPIANVMMSFAENSQLATYVNQMPMTLFIINNAAIFFGAYLLSAGFALYVKFNKGPYGY